MGAIPAPEGRIEFGNPRATWVRLSDVNILQQTRQEYNAEAIDELADSMVYYDDDGERHFELINDVMVGIFDEVHMAKYLHEHSRHYGQTIHQSQLRRAEDGHWHVAIAGHRRTLAMRRNCERFGISYDDAYVSTSPKPNISFQEALALQLKENVHLRPPAIDEAKQIDRYYRQRAEDEGQAPTIASCARSLGFSESKIADALRFARLPGEVQTEASAGMISYGHAVQLFPYVSVLERYYPLKYGDVYSDPSSGRTVEDDVAASTMVLVKKLKSKELSGASAARKTEIIKANIAAIQESLDYHDQGLFELAVEAEAPRQALDRTGRALGKQALAIIMQRILSGEVSDDELAILADIRHEIAALTEKQTRDEAADATIFDLPTKSA